MTGAEHCVYCGDFFECRDHVIPVSYASVYRDYRRGSTVHCCLRCNGLLSNKAYHTVRDRAEFLVSRYREAHGADLAFPDWSESELSEMAPKMRRAIRGRLSKRTLIRLKIDNLERVCLGIPVEPIDPLFVRGRRIVGDDTGDEGEEDRAAAVERRRVARAVAVEESVRFNYSEGVLFRRFKRGAMTIIVVDMDSFRDKYGIPPNLMPPTWSEIRLGIQPGALQAAKGWRLTETASASHLTEEQALLEVHKLLWKGAVAF